jgi:hypothetical protein
MQKLKTERYINSDSMAKAKWFFEKTVDIIVDIIGGLVLYLIVGGYITESLPNRNN